MQVDEHQHVACIGRIPMQFTYDVKGQTGRMFCWKRYGFDGSSRRCMSTLSRCNAGSAVHHEFLDVVVDTRPADSLTSSLLYLQDAALVYMCEFKNTLAQGERYQRSYLGLKHTVQRRQFTSNVEVRSKFGSFCLCPMPSIQKVTVKQVEVGAVDCFSLQHWL